MGLCPSGASPKVNSEAACSLNRTFREASACAVREILRTIKFEVMELASGFDDEERTRRCHIMSVLYSVQIYLLKVDVQQPFKEVWGIFKSVELCYLF